MNSFIKKLVSASLSLVILSASINMLPSQAETASSSYITYRRYSYATGTWSDYNLYSADPIANSMNPSRYDYPDNRIEDDDTSVVKLSFAVYNENGTLVSYTGTGFIVDTNIIATCAHCVYNRSSLNPDNTTGMFAINYTISIYDDDFSYPLATFSPVSVHIPKTYITSLSEPERSSFEYALLYLGEDVNLSQYGVFDLGVANDDYLINEGDVKCSGFPQQVNGGLNPTGGRYISDGQMGMFDIQNSIYQYPASCDKRFHATTVNSGGDSGGPVYAVSEFGNSEYHTVIGICSGGSYDMPTATGSGTYGVRITADLLRFYRWWDGGRVK